MMLNRILVTLCMVAAAAAAADQTGTWKLNTAKSKYTGVPAPKELITTYTPAGSGWRYEAKGTSGTGDPINSSFNYVKDGEEIRTTGFPMWDAMVLQNANSEKATGTLKRSGRTVGSVTRTISADGKTMTIRANVMTPEGKKASYLSVYEKQ
jgi:hypothetical protein